MAGFPSSLCLSTLLRCDEKPLLLTLSLSSAWHIADLVLLPKPRAGKGAGHMAPRAGCSLVWSWLQTLS